MHHVQLQMLILVGFALLAGVFILLVILDARRTRHRLDVALAAIGLRPVDRSAWGPVAQRLTIVHPRHTGKRLLMRLYQRPSPAGKYALYVCDYAFASASGRTSGSRWLLVCLISDRLAWPRLHVEGTPALPGWAQRLEERLAGALDIPAARRWISGDSHIDQRYRLYVFQDALPAKPESLLRLLRGSPPGLVLDLAGDTLVLTSIEVMADRVRRAPDPQRLLGLIHLAEAMYDALKK